MALENSQSQFLWQLFQLYFINGLDKDALKRVGTMYECSLDFPKVLESLLLSYWEDGKDVALVEAAIMAVRQFYFEPEQHILLIAVLVERSLIDVNEAASLMVFAGKNPETFPKSIQHAIDVAWLINQDVKYSAMNAEQDSLLKDTLRNLMVQFKAEKIKRYGEK